MNIKFPLKPFTPPRHMTILLKESFSINFSFSNASSGLTINTLRQSVSQNFYLMYHKTVYLSGRNVSTL